MAVRFSENVKEKVTAANSSNANGTNCDLFTVIICIIAGA